jgi:hypothetical protein
MRLSDWRTKSPSKEAGSPKVAAVVEPVLVTMGAGPDPSCWVAWGEEPGMRYTILVPTEPGLIVAFVRVIVPGEGPRASAKLVRWNRVQVGELGVETQAGHRLLSFQVEGVVLRGVDDEADQVAAFALRLIAAIDGRPLPAEPEATAAARPRSSGTKAASATPRPVKAAPSTAAPARTASARARGSAGRSKASTP